MNGHLWIFYTNRIQHKTFYDSLFITLTITGCAALRRKEIFMQSSVIQIEYFYSSYN